MILAADIGGTKSRLGLFAGATAVCARTYRTADFESPAELVEAFLGPLDLRPRHAFLAVASPVQGRSAPRTVLPWAIDADELARELGMRAVGLVNDVAANARGLAELDESDFAVVHAGAAEAGGTKAVVSAGTGLGEAALWWDGERHRPAPSEGGSCSFAPRSELEVELYRFLAAERGHVSYGRVCSGPGLRNLYRFLSGGEAPEPALIAAEAEADRSSVASAAVDLFVSIYGARAGDVALSYMATGGVYLGGGIAPRLVSRLREGGFARAFVAKGGLEPVVRRIPVRVVLNADAALVGAAAFGRDAFEHERGRRAA